MSSAQKNREREKTKIDTDDCQSASLEQVPELEDTFVRSIEHFHMSYRERRIREPAFRERKREGKKEREKEKATPGSAR